MKISPIEVSLIGSFGTDLTVVNAARVSFAKESVFEKDSETGNEKLSEKDSKLISYLAKHNHWTPFGHCSASFRIKAPIFVARQLGKHQVGLVWNEVSRRYVDEEPEFWFPEEWRGRPENAKQGSSGVIASLYIKDTMKESISIPLSIYKSYIALGVAPEQARMILPQNTHTEWIWTGTLMAWIRVMGLRLDPHAQQETRDLVQKIHDQLLPIFPRSISAWLSKET